MDIFYLVLAGTEIWRRVVFEIAAVIRIAPLVLGRMIVIAVMMVMIKIIIAGVNFVIAKKVFDINTHLFLCCLQTRLLLLHCA